MIKLQEYFLVMAKKLSWCPTSSTLLGASYDKLDGLTYRDPIC